MMITRRQRPDLVVGPRVWDRTGMLELEGQVLESPPSPSAVPHRSPSMGAGNLEWVPGLTTSDARHDMSVAVPPHIRDTDAVVVCCTRARPSVRTVASFKYHRTVHVWLGGQALRAQHSEWRCCVLNVKIGPLRYVYRLPPTSLARSCAAIQTGNNELELTANTARFLILSRYRFQVAGRGFLLLWGFKRFLFSTHTSYAEYSLPPRPVQ